MEEDIHDLLHAKCLCIWGCTHSPWSRHCQLPFIHEDSITEKEFCPKIQEMDIQCFGTLGSGPFTFLWDWASRCNSGWSWTLVAQAKFTAILPQSRVLGLQMCRCAQPKLFSGNRTGHRTATEKTNALREYTEAVWVYFALPLLKLLHLFFLYVPIPYFK